MKVKLAITRIILFMVVLGMAGLAGLGYVLQRSDLKTLQDLSKENIMWSAAQLEIELHRFLGALGGLSAGDPDITPDDIVDRFDILWSRAVLFETGEVADRLNRYDAETKAIHALFETLQTQEDAVFALAEADDPDATAAMIVGVMEAFNPHARALRDLSVRVIGGEETRGAASRDSIREGQFMAATLSAGAIVMSALLIAVTFFEARKYRALASHNAQLAREADAANQAKSRFLTMMSHELRTPMNGVLGQLALAKSPGLPDPQLQLIERAERSGRQMIDMLTDILDFSALQENQLAIDRRAFRLGAYATALTDLYASNEKNGRPPLAVSCDDAARVEVVADAQRIRQSTAHLISYILDTAGASDIAVDVGYQDGEIRTVLSFRYDTGGEAGWRPDMLLGEPRRSTEQFASDALGPMVARGLIETMGGRIALTSLAAERTVVTIAVPADAVRRVNPRVWLDAASATMRMICEAALRTANVELAADGATADEVDIALFEAGRDDEASKLQTLRQRYPKARIIAIGHPSQPEIFDGVTPTPLNAERLRDVLEAKAA